MESNLRRYRTGFVELVSPVTHVWYLISRPSKIALILNIPLKELEKVVYFNSSSIGAEAIKTLLNRLDLEAAAKALRSLIPFAKDSEDSERLKREKMIKRLRLIDQFLASGSSPS